jgi:hypothetical protein
MVEGGCVTGIPTMRRSDVETFPIFINPSAATLMSHLASVANKRLTI